MQAYWFLIEYFASNHIDFMWEFLKQPIWHRCCYCCDTEVLVWRCRLCFLQRPNFVLTCQQHNNGFASCVFIWQGLRCCRKLSPVGATWSWSRWCSRRTSLPPPGRPSCYIWVRWNEKSTKKVDPFQNWFFVISDHYWTGLGWFK